MSKPPASEAWCICRRHQDRGPIPSMEGWYRRWENNGWRPIAPRMFEDPEAAAEERKLPAFGLTLLVRRQEREAARRLRRRQWMAKLYA